MRDRIGFLIKDLPSWKRDYFDGDIYLTKDSIKIFFADGDSWQCFEIAEYVRIGDESITPVELYRIANELDWEAAPQWIKDILTPAYYDPEKI